MAGGGRATMAALRARGKEGLPAAKGAGKASSAVVRMDPVGVKERVSPAHEPQQAVGIIEVQRGALDLAGQVRRRTGIIRQGLDLVACGEEPAGDEAAGVAEGAGADSNPGPTRSWIS